MGMHKLKEFIEKNLSSHGEGSNGPPNKRLRMDEACNRYCYYVDIKKLSDKYRIENKKEPVIFVDGTSYLHEFYKKGNRDFLLGGQLIDFLEDSKSFVQKFEGIGVKLQFFFDGSTTDTRRGPREKRNKKKIERNLDIFKSLSYETNIKAYYVNDTLQLPLLISVAGRYILKYGCNCDVYVSTQECDLEMAFEARKKDTFAIMANDGDFVIHRGAQYYFSLADLNLKKMRTVNYDRQALMKILSLNPKQFALFGALLYRDAIDHYILLEVMKFICEGKEKMPIIKVANFVERETSACKDDIQKSMYTISKHLQKCRIAPNIQVNDPDFKLCQWFEVNVKIFNPDRNLQEEHEIQYSENHSWNKILTVAHEMYVTCEMRQDVYNTLQTASYEIGVFLEAEENDFAPSLLVFQKVRKHIYGILFHEKINPIQETVEEWGSWNGIPFQSVKVNVKSVDSEHPGLITLWTSETSNVENQKWNLLTKSVSSSLCVSLLKQLKRSYLVPMLVLYYLKHETNVNLEDWEIKAFILQAAAVMTYSLDDLRQLDRQVPSARLVNLCTLFSAGVSTMIFLMSTCGFKLDEVLPWKYFDGPLFHYVYNNYEIDITILENKLKHSVWRDFVEMSAILFPEISSENESKD